MKQILAANLRRLRIAHHLSLSELARVTGVSKATLSGIERGNANPTVETLAALAGELGVPLGELLAEPELAPIRIVRAGDASAGSGASPDRWRTIDGFVADGEAAVAELSLAPGEVEEVAPRAPGARTQLLVLQGKLIAGPVERVSELASGDYASFPADVAQRIEAGARPARALVLTLTPR